MEDQRFIALMRAINVHNRHVKMQDLKELLSTLSYIKDFKTYIQTGNIIFSSSLSVSSLEKKLSNDFEEEFGFKVPVIVYTGDDFKSIIEKNPFTVDQEGEFDSKKLYFTFLKKEPKEQYKKNMETIDSGKDEFVLEKKVIYIKLATKYCETKLTNPLFERKLKVEATTRNFNVVNKLIELSFQRDTQKKKRNGEKTTKKRNRTIKDKTEPKLKKIKKE